MMKNTHITIAVVVVVIAVAGFFFARSKSSDTLQNSENTNTETVQETSGKKMAFSQFVKQGGSYKCEVNQYIAGTETHGTTYINAGMVRGEYTTSVNGMTISNTMIVRDGYTYSWSSMAPSMGFKAKVVEGAGGSTAGMSGSYSWNTDNIGDYSCEEWSADTTVFAVPSNITFQTVN